MRWADLATAAEVLAEALGNAEYRAEWERTALARAVALALTRYRAKHGLSQRALAQKLGMKQPAIARLEVGEHNPSLETLYRLSQQLGIHITLDLTPAGRTERWVREDVAEAEVREEFTTANGDRVLIAAG